jgi:hypothetical protein
MTQVKPLTAEQMQAFTQTNFVVHHEPPFTLNIGILSSDIKNLMAKHNVNCAAFITAWNPFSQTLATADDNLARQEKLKEHLKMRSLKYIDGLGEHPDKNWPAEPSVLILGLSLEAAKTLAIRCEQRAFVWVGSNAVPGLVRA